jgi:flavin reductase (DIM6/NTAB) family NADH-FMN oxidoreductase RutF
MQDDEPFHILVSELQYPMFIVTTAVGGLRAGCLVGFASQASIEPLRMLILLSKANYTCKVAQGAERLAVHFPHQDNRRLAALFGEETGDNADKFAACTWSENPEGLPILAGTRGWAVGRILQRIDCGDHVGHLLHLTTAHLDTPGEQLGYQSVRTMRPGHQPDE